MIECRVDRESRTMHCVFPTKKMDTSASNDADKDFLKFLSGEGADSIVFDLAGVTYVASSFLRLCISAAGKVEKGRFSVINTDPQIMKVFKIAGLDSVLNVS
ncbi:MAG: STAS domain-containing protein [bacterium]